MTRKITLLTQILFFAATSTLLACAASGTDSIAEPAKTVDTAMLADTNASLGRLYFIQCQACHTLAEDGVNQVGPNLWGVVGRRAGQRDDFNYSTAFDDADIEWTLAALDEFLIKPNDYVPGTLMIFNGIAEEEKRRDLLAYLLQETTPTEDR